MAAGIAMTGWLVVSILVIVTLLAVRAWKGQQGLGAILITGPFSKFSLTFLSVTFSWLLGGLALWLLRGGYINARNALSWGGFFLVSFLYLNIMRERLQYGDLDAYILGATNLYRGQPFDGLYIYPPFWAMLLKPLVPYGDKAFLNVLWALNMLGLMAFYWLLVKLLERYGFSTRLAALSVSLFMIANVAVIRSMFYMQVNLNVLNLIFLSLLLYPRSRLISALCLAVAVHLKASPLVLGLAFLLERDWKWLAWLAFFGFFIFGATLLAYGWQPYASYLNNLAALNAPHGVNFRETSFDSFFWVIAQFLGLDYIFPRIAIYLAKAALGVATMLVMLRTVRRQTFHQGEAARLLNAIPPLLVMMNMFSPLVWEHHGVFLALGAFALLRVLSTPGDWTWFGLFYFLQFLVPTFDFFPWSYVRMLTPLLQLWLMWRASAQEAGEAPIFQRANRWLDSFPLQQPSQS
jgi:hypothetical protein